jgi:hypothetical protein
MCSGESVGCRRLLNRDLTRLRNWNKNRPQKELSHRGRKGHKELTGLDFSRGLSFALSARPPSRIVLVLVVVLVLELLPLLVKNRFKRKNRAEVAKITENGRICFGKGDLKFSPHFVPAPGSEDVPRGGKTRVASSTLPWWTERDCFAGDGPINRAGSKMGRWDRVGCFC